MSHHEMSLTEKLALGVLAYVVWRQFFSQPVYLGPAQTYPGGGSGGGAAPHPMLPHPVDPLPGHAAASPPPGFRDPNGPLPGYADPTTTGSATTGGDGRTPGTPAAEF